MPDTITCPNCRAAIQISEALSAQLRDQLREQFDAEMRHREKDFSDREHALARRQAEIDTAKQALDREVQTRLAAERDHLAKEAREKARQEVALDLKDKQAELDEARSKLRQAQEGELDIRRRARELEDQKREFQITLARRLDEEREKIRESNRREVAEQRSLKDAEKDKHIADLKRQIDDLKRKSEQGSQQLQGEVMELELEDLLRRHFVYDTIDPVPKGVHGGDVLQRVHNHNGHHCGTILWESKRTRNWTDAWLPKLRDDQRAAKADLAILVSSELPRDVANFTCLDGVWVTNWACAISLAHALRGGLLELANAKQAAEGRQGKVELLYNYLSGTEFRHRVEGIVEAFVTLRQELEAEKRALQRLWAKREKHIERAVASTAGLYGDLGGIVGQNLPAIESLKLPSLPAVDAATGGLEPEASAA